MSRRYLIILLLISFYSESLFSARAIHCVDSTNLKCSLLAENIDNSKSFYYIEHNNTAAKNDKWISDNIISLVSSIIALVGFFIAISELKRQARSAEAELALKLDDKIYTFRSIYKELFEGGAYYQVIPDKNIEDIESYLTFYDTLSILIRNKQIKLDQINSLYGYRFITLMHNSSVQKIIKAKINSWKGLIWLYPNILELRKKSNNEIPRKENEWKLP